MFVCEELFGISDLRGLTHVDAVQIKEEAPIIRQGLSNTIPILLAIGGPKQRLNRRSLDGKGRPSQALEKSVDSLSVSCMSKMADSFDGGCSEDGLFRYG